MAIASPSLVDLARVVCATVALAERIRKVPTKNCSVYGVRKKWHALARQGIDIGWEQSARLMRMAKVAGKPKGGSPITTDKPTGPDNRPNLKRICVHRFYRRGVLPPQCRLCLGGFDSARGVVFASTEPSFLLSIKSLLRLKRWMIPMAMYWRKTSTARTKMSSSIPGGGVMLLRVGPPGHS